MMNILNLLFPFYLGASADDWPNSHPHHSLTTWEEVIDKFLNHFFLESRVEAIKERIVNFKEAPTKSLFDAWEWYKALLRNFPCYGYNQFMQISKFMKGINSDCRRMINASVGGNYLNKTTIQVKTIIEDLNRNNSKGPSQRNPNKRSCVKNAKEAIKHQNASRYQWRRLTTWEDNNGCTITSNKEVSKSYMETTTK